MTADDIVAAVKDELAGYKAPRHVVFVDVVPRAANGKPDHASARRHALTTIGIVPAS